jgi:hypothetical protein
VVESHITSLMCIEYDTTNMSYPGMIIRCPHANMNIAIIIVVGPKVLLNSMFAELQLEVYRTWQIAPSCNSR